MMCLALLLDRLVAQHMTWGVLLHVPVMSYLHGFHHGDACGILISIDFVTLLDVCTVDLQSEHDLLVLLWMSQL